MHNIKYEKLLNKNSFVEFFISPWDKEAFGFKIVIITEFKGSRSGGAEVIKDLFEWCKAHSIRQCNIRIDRTKVNELSHLQNAGFHFMDTSLRVNVDLQKITTKDELLRCNLKIASNIEREAAAQIAFRAFSCERYHFDPNIDNDLANIRFKLWIKNSDNPNNILLVGKEGSKVTSFFLSRIEDDGSLYFSLAGIDPEFTGLGYFVYYVWRTIIKIINPAIKSMHMGLIKLIDQIRMLDNDMIRLQEKVDTVLQIKENEKINRSSNTISRNKRDSR